MERYKKGEDRNQYSCELMCLDDMIPADAEVRTLEIIIDKMDVCSLGFTHHKTKSTGRMPYNPADMFKIYAYSYFNGIRSSRKIERECYRNIELMWLVGKLKPDFKTIADFRKDNKHQIQAAFQKFGVLCGELGLIGKEIVAVDGSKFRACNSRLRYHSQKKIEEKIKHHAEKAKAYVKLLDSCDGEESAQPQLSKEEILSKLDHINSRLVELSLLKDQVAKTGTIYETDPDSRMMKTNNNGCDICHNVQIAVDDKNHLVVAVDVTSQAIDKEQLFNMAAQAKTNMGTDAITVVADKGYYSAKQFEKCVTAGITAIVSKANHSNAAASEEYSKEMFSYDEKADTYTCPQGQVLKRRKSRQDSKFKNYPMYANQVACKKCLAREYCTRGDYRTICDRPLHEYARQVDVQTKANMDMYHQRKQLVEHPFGTVKRGFGFSYFLTRGTENVRTESVLHFLVYNMKRVMNIIGTEELRLALQA